MLCDIVIFITSETTSTTQAILKQKSKIHVKEEEKLEMPAVKKVTSRSKEHKEDHEVISLKSVKKIQREEPPKESGQLLQKVEKSEIVGEEMVYSKAVTEVKLTSSYEVTKDTWSYETATKTEKISKGEEKKIEQYKDVCEQKGITPEIGGRDEEKTGKQGTKVPIEEEPKIPQPSLKKVTKSISTEKEQETVKLKPVEKSDKAVVGQQKDSDIDRSKDSIGVQKHERLIKDEPVSKKKIEVTPIDQTAKESMMPKPAVAKDEISKEQEKFPKKAKRTLSQDEEPEIVTLKPFSKESHADVTPEKVTQEQKEKKPVDIKHPERPETHHILKEPHIQVKEPGKSEKTFEEPEKIKKLESPHDHLPVKSTTTPEKTTQEVPKEEKAITKKRGIIPKDEAKKEEVSLKPVERKIIAQKTPSPKVDKPSPQVTSLTKKSPKDDDKPAMSEKIGLPPKEMKGKEPGELKKTPSPKTEIPKPKPTESIPMERKSSVKSPKKISPKDSLESVILKKVAKTFSPKEEKTTQEPPLKTSEDKVPVVKELSPSVLHLQKIPTQQEEVVYEHEQEAVNDEDEETWGWELAPRDSYGSETFDDDLEDGAVETPGMGDKKGEMVAPKAYHWLLMAPYSRSK